MPGVQGWWAQICSEVEILIGWLQCIYTIRVAGYDSALRPPHGPPGATPPKRGYISQDPTLAARRIGLRQVYCSLGV